MFDIEQLADSGELFDNNYKLIRPLNTNGGTADVWLALDARTVKNKKDLGEAQLLEDSYLDRIGLLVAIKIYRPKNALDIEGEQRFRDEYMIVFNCHHANLIHPTHFSIFNETPYLVLPYCKRGSSELLIGNVTEEGGIWKYIYDVTSGLAYLHNSCNPPIIHQDIKPGNVLIDDYGNYAITDFGISVKRANQQDYLDEENSGTLAYMAPERFNPDVEPSAEGDMWAFGATLCELITGKVPFGENGGEAQLNGQKMVPLPKKLPRTIKGIINDCLSQNPSKRPTAELLAEEARKRLYPTTYKHWYLILSFVIFTIAIVVFFFGASPPNFEESESLQENKETPTTYQVKDAVQFLSSSETALRGIEILDSLSLEGDSKATYLLSRIFFSGNRQGDNNAVEDSIKKLKKNIDVEFLLSRKNMAHTLLKTCFEQDSLNYHVCYLLGLDYWGGPSRQEGVERNVELAKAFLNKALYLATQNHDELFAKIVRDKLNQL